MILGQLLGETLGKYWFNKRTETVNIVLIEFDTWLEKSLRKQIDKYINKYPLHSSVECNMPIKFDITECHIKLNEFLEKENLLFACGYTYNDKVKLRIVNAYKNKE